MKLKMAEWLFKLCSSSLVPLTILPLPLPLCAFHSSSFPEPLFPTSSFSSLPPAHFLFFSSFFVSITYYLNSISLNTIHSHSHSHSSFSSSFPSNLTHHTLPSMLPPSNLVIQSYRNMILSPLEVMIVNKFLSVLRSQTGQLSPCYQYPVRNN